MPGCLEQIRGDTAPDSALTYSFILQAVLCRRGLSALGAEFQV